MRGRVMWALLVVALAACGGDDEPSSAADGTESIIVTDAWLRPPAGPNAAIYMTIENDGAEADTLLSAQGDICSTTELHMTTVEDDVMTMSPLPDGIAITPGATVVLGPGALHIMCLDVDPELPEGSATLTLQFATAGQLTVSAEVRREP